MAIRSLDNTLSRNALSAAEMDGSMLSPYVETLASLDHIADGIRQIQETTIVVETRLEAFMRTHCLDGIDEAGLDLMGELPLVVRLGFLLLEDLEDPTEDTLLWYAGDGDEDAPLSLYRLFTNMVEHPDFWINPATDSMYPECNATYTVDDISEWATDKIGRAFLMYDLDIVLSCVTHSDGMDRFEVSLVDDTTGLAVRRLVVARNGMIIEEETYTHALAVSFCNSALRSGRLLDIVTPVTVYPDLDSPLEG